MSYREQAPEALAALDRDALLQAWQEAADDLHAAKTRENALRMLAFQKAFPNAIEGTNNLTLGSGWLLKCTYPFNYKVEDTPEMRKALAKLPADIQPRLVKWQPKLSTGTFNRLEQKFVKVFAPFVTRTPGSPQLALLAPGDEGNKK